YYFFNSPEGDEKISALQGGGLVVNLSLNSF
ncbi:type I restriction endonuclease subunit M, partial [Salmonella enterica subsp. enterica serovar Enteritidis]|nr:type I restriction endonuclease subunit M [Salmonella enterica subsp. enterica serovar Enteritidis]